MRHWIVRAVFAASLVVLAGVPAFAQTSTLSARWKIGDLIVGAGALVAGLIAWFK